MSRLSRFALVLVLGGSVALLAAGCGSDSAGADASITLFDAAPPAPDAFVCNLTECGNECVDTSTSERHCGGCNMACASPAQSCQGQLPCVCPAAFVPATFTALFTDIRDDVLPPPALAGVIIFGSAGVTNLFTVGYDPDEITLDTEIELGELEVPGIAAGYDVDIFSMSVRALYFVSEGTITFTTACATGVSGVVADATFVEADLSGQIVEDGCSFNVEEISFSIGNCD
jgi:hypothetical protein